MRFEDVSERLGAMVNNPDGRDHGVPLNVSIPHLANARLWQAVHGGYSWVIAYEPGVPTWSDTEKKNFIGYSASYRAVKDGTSSGTIKIDGGPWDSFAKAEEASKRVWKQIRSPQ